MEDRELLHEYYTQPSPQLREALILRYAPLVHFVLGRLGISSASSADYEDASSEGMIGLMEAVDGFNPAYGTQFSTYATLRIRGRVLDHLRAMDWLSRTARRRTRQLQQGMTVLWNQLGRAPSDEELAQHLEVDLPTLQQSLTDASLVIVSMDSLHEGSGEGESEAVSLHDVLQDANQPDPAEQVEAEDLKHSLVCAIQGLSEREQLVLSLYYYNELTLKEVGEVLSVSESRVCQLHARAILSLKSALKGSSQPEAAAQTEAAAGPAALSAGQAGPKNRRRAVDYYRETQR